MRLKRLKGSTSNNLGNFGFYFTVAQCRTRKDWPVAQLKKLGWLGLEYSFSFYLFLNFWNRLFLFYFLDFSIKYTATENDPVWTHQITNITPYSDIFYFFLIWSTIFSIFEDREVGGDIQTILHYGLKTKT